MKIAIASGVPLPLLQMSNCDGSGNEDAEFGDWTAPVWREGGWGVCRYWQVGKATETLVAEFRAEW